jgi:hypothetical protein
MTSDSPMCRLFLVTSGWEGPFQFEQVLVGAADCDRARRAAEAEFARVAQPVCRAKMRVADLGPARQGVIAGPARSGEPLAAGSEVDARCGAEPAGAGPAAAQTPGP